jgi:hypothetical protein
MGNIPPIPDIPEDQRTPVVTALLETLQLYREMILSMRDEIARLKGEKGRPKIPPSKLDKNTDDQPKNKDDSGKRPGSSKRSKTAELQIHEVLIIEAENVPPGSEFKGYEEYTVQGLKIELHNIRYRRERWHVPSGETLIAPLPKDVLDLDGGHYNNTLIAFILSQYYHAHVTQPLILEQIQEWGIDISAGQINRIITENHDRFHAEKNEILRVGLENSSYVNVDDTGARHKGKNGYCTHIGNEWFAWFQSTGSKSRINFLELLRAGGTDYTLNSDARDYMIDNLLPKGKLDILFHCEQTRFSGAEEWNVALEKMGITNERNVRIATEGALLGSILEHGINPGIVIVSDDAGQFNVFLHSLCWVHAERLIHKLVGYNEKQRNAVEDIRSRIWDLYRDLKEYRKEPSVGKKTAIEARFDEVFTTKTCFETLNQALKRLHANKAELLLVLERPEIPIHNNTSERDIREYVKKRKISGSTRSDLGRRCRDTFVSLKKTCRKLGVSFWQFLGDRLSGRDEIPPLPEIVRQRIHADQGCPQTSH